MTFGQIIISVLLVGGTIAFCVFEVIKFIKFIKARRQLKDKNNNKEVKK